MKVALLYSYDPEQTSPTEEEISDWLALDEDVKKAGKFVYEAGFQPTHTAKWIRTRNGRASSEPHPTGDVGEVIAGFYILEVESLEEAARWAERIPTAAYGRVEVRPIVEFEPEG